MKTFVSHFLLRIGKSATINLMIALVLLSSCSKEEEVTEPVVFTITENDAAEFLAVVLSVNTYGFAANAIHFSEEVSNTLHCGAQSENNGTRIDSTQDASITYKYSFNETYGYTCDNNGGEVNYSFVAEQSLETLRMDVNSDVSGIWALSNVDDNNSNYSLSGVYDRSSDRVAKAGSLSSMFIHTLLQFESLSVDKSSGYLVGGALNFELTGNRISGEAFEGVVDFKDPEATEVSFINGNTYVLNLLTGSIQKI